MCGERKKKNPFIEVIGIIVASILTIVPGALMRENVGIGNFVEFLNPGVDWITNAF